MTQSSQHPTRSGFVELALASRDLPPSSRPARLANGEPLDTRGLVTLLAAAAIVLSIVVVTPGMGG